MADTREVKIVLETRGGTESSETERVDTQASAAATSKNESSSSGKQAAKVLIGTLISEAANEAVAWAAYEVNKEFTLNDDYIGQRNLQIATQAVNWGISSATTIASTTMMGATFGPIGAAVGALVGTGMVAARTIRENVQAMEQQDIMLNQMQAQLDYTRQRSGWSLKAASIGEDL